MSYRITRVKCPSCKGTGKARVIDFLPCPTCGGEKKATTESLRKQADWIWVLAGGGYIAGDHSLEDMRSMEREAKELRALADRMETAA